MDEIRNIEYLVSDSNANKRLDKYLSENLIEFSRSYIQVLIDDEKVFVNDSKKKASYKVQTDDRINVIIEPLKELLIEPKDIPIEILYEDSDVIVVNKPKGMPVHPSNGHFDDTLVNAIMFTHKNCLSGINGVLRPGIVHRIDMDTTGSLIICKTDESHRCIADQIKVHSVFRKYLAIVHGIPKERSGVVNAPIGRDPNNRLKMAVTFSGNGKEAITNYKIIEEYRGFSLCEFVLETGRTHQIRVHMQSIGHPILGDSVYGPKKPPYKLQGQCLHAYTIGFTSPSTGKYIEINAPLPEYFNHLLTILPRI